MDAPVPARSPRYTTLDQWLAWFETLHPKKIDFSLDRIRRVLSVLGIERPAYRIVTVAGTNGKGSCVAMLESIYREAGFRVGAFTSPHLLTFNERIRIDGHDASDATLIALFDAIDRALGEVTLSYFESSAVAALLGFARAGVDVAVLEVGMGGRLDAVNAVDADAALIVSVDIDHVDWLGPDREAIGREKAGIVRAGRPAIVADADPPASVRAAIDTAGAFGCFVGRDYSVRVDANGIVWRAADGRSLKLPRPRFGGAVQSGNAGACVAVVERLQTLLPVDDDAIVRGLAAAFLKGRLDLYRVDGVEWLFDVAHNAAAAERLAAAVSRLPPAAGPTHAVFGVMRDKQIDAVVAPLLDTVDTWHLAPVDSDRTATAAELQALLGRLGAKTVVLHADIAGATAYVREIAPRRVIVFGSFYTVGPAMQSLGLYSAAHPPRDPKAWTQG